MWSRPSTEEDWISLGVDDLTKFRIVEHLYRHLDDEVEVSTLASSLGFHSVDQTLAALRELAQAGAIWLESTPRGLPRCGPAREPAVHARIAGLLAFYQEPAAAANLLARLASRSLAKAEARVKRHHNTGGHANGSSPAPGPQWRVLGTGRLGH